MEPVICQIDEEGRIFLPADLRAMLRERGIRHVAIMETWDGFRLEPVADGDAAALMAPQDKADQINSLIAAMAGRDQGDA